MPALAEVGIALLVVGRARRGRPRSTSSRLRGAHLPGAHPAGGRPRPPVPLHLRPVAEPRGRAPRPRQRRAPLRPGEGAAVCCPGSWSCPTASASCRSSRSSPPTSTSCSPAWRSRATIAFRVTRNADLTLEEEEADDLLAAVEIELRRRRFGRAVRLEIDEPITRRDPRPAPARARRRRRRHVSRTPDRSTSAGSGRCTSSTGPT